MKGKLKNLIIVFLVIVIAYCGWNLALIYMDYKEADDFYESARQEFMLEEVQEQEEAAGISATAGSGVEIPLDKRIDFEKLKSVNEDIDGWIYIKGTNVDYPLLMSQKNNNEYIYTTYENKYSSHGSIFMDYRNSRNFLDENTVIYGHNMQNGSMFGNLMKYGKNDYANEHKTINILTYEGVRVYEVYSAYRTVANSESYDFTFSVPSEFQKFLDMTMNNSAIDTGVTVTQADKIITLSTCADSEQSVNRFVVHARFVGFEGE